MEKNKKRKRRRVWFISFLFLLGSDWIYTLLTVFLQSLLSLSRFILTKWFVFLYSRIMLIESSRLVHKFYRKSYRVRYTYVNDQGCETSWIPNGYRVTRRVEYRMTVQLFVRLSVLAGDVSNYEWLLETQFEIKPWAGHCQL